MTSPAREHLTRAQARRIALAAQGFGRPASAPVTPASLTRLVRRLGVLQIDSVNVLARAHLLPPFSRLGPWDPALLDRSAGQRPRRLVEAWAHQASYIPVETYPLLGWRRADAAKEAWGSISSVARQHPDLVADVAALVRERGPLTARAIQDAFEDTHPRQRDHWGWNWSVAKRAAEYLFFTGQLAIAGRGSQFERLYDVPDRVLPAGILALPEPPRADAIRELTLIAARAHGIGTAACLADYFRVSVAETTAAIGDLIEAGELREVTVEGWRRPAYLHTAARRPRRVGARALLTPFDPLVFFRRRTEELFAMRYRIGIYTPAHQRTDGYYVLPYLLGERLAARVDLKADRARGELIVTGAWLGESDGDAPDGGANAVAEALGQDLARLAGWLGLTSLRVAAGAPGDLTAALAPALAAVAG